MDNRSFRINDEANMNILDADFAAEQTRIFNEDKSHAERISYEAWKHRPVTEILFGSFAQLFKKEL
jgi:cardiolipin synthase